MEECVTCLIGMGWFLIKDCAVSRARMGHRLEQTAIVIITYGSGYGGDEYRVNGGVRLGVSVIGRKRELLITRLLQTNNSMSNLVGV